MVDVVPGNETYECLGANKPCNPPPWKSKALGEAVDDDNIVFIDIFDILGGTDDGTVTFVQIVIATVELIHDQGGTVAAKILNLRELRVGYDLARGVTWVRSEDDAGSTGDFFGNLVWVDVPSILSRERDWDGRESAKEREHLVVR